MKTIRSNVFETNSSSCHSVTLISKSDYESLQDGVKYPYDVDFWYDEHESTIIKLPSDKFRTVEEIYQDLTNVLNDTTSEYLQEDKKVVKENWSVDYVKKCLANPYDYNNDIINSFWEYFSYSDIASDKLNIISKLDEIIDKNSIQEFNDTYIFEGDIEC